MIRVEHSQGVVDAAFTLSVQLVTRDAAASEDPVISVLTQDVEGAYEEAQALGDEIVHPLTTEPWGVRRSSSEHPTATSSTSSGIGTEPAR